MIGIFLAAVWLAQFGRPGVAGDAVPAVRQIDPPAPYDAKTGRWRSSGPSGGEVNGIAVDPADSRVEYATMGNGYTNDEHRIGGIFKTVDGGSSWREVGPPEESFFTVAVAHSDPHVVYASSYAALWRSTDGGRSWTTVLTAIYGPPSRAEIDPADANHVWVVADGSARRSIDGGATWTPMFAAEGVGFDSGVPSRLHRVRLEETGIDGYSLRFAYSDDRGATWSSGGTFDRGYGPGRIVGDPTDPDTVYTTGDIFRSTDRGASWTRLPNDLGRFSDLAVDPLHPDTLYGATGNDLFVSRDDGTTWTVILDALAGSVAAVPFDGFTRVFAGTYRGLYASDDGNTWTASVSGLRGAPWQSIALDPTSSGAIYAEGSEGFAASRNGGSTWSEDLMSPAAGSAVAVSPADPSRILASGWSSGIVRSRDAGATWEAVFSPYGNASTIVFDPKNPSTVYAAVFYPIKSTDGGETWHSIIHGVESYSTNTIAVDSGDSSIVHLLTYQNALFRSTDAGETWVLDAGLDLGYYTRLQALLADLGRPGVVWVGTSSGLYRGDSSGTVWSPTGLVDSVVAVAADGAPEGALYVASASGVVSRSLDEGATWEPLGTGLPPRVISSLLVDEKRGVLYAATNDGVYSLDLRRQPHALPPR
ncbi:MAG TPA: hypothetical protein VGH97_12345 [Thermoanaerobaculia bacterium]|jgi:photosystem II stability/assembly factor-like uncharacterized protein